MYDIKKKQYIVKLSSGRIMNYFIDDRLGLMYSILAKRNIWSDPVPAIRDCAGRIALEVDGEDRIHVLYQTRQGNIFYAVYANNNWINHPVLNAKNPGVYDKNLQLRLIGPDTHFFYTLRHNDNIILGHQSIMNKNQLTSPEVVDYVPANDIPYTVNCDKQGNLYVYFASSDGKYKQVGYRVLTKNTGKWSEFKPVTSFNGDHENPKAIIDHSDNFHLIYTRRANNGYELVYRSRPSTQSLWGMEKVISNSNESYPTASLICINEEIILFWVKENGIFYSTLPSNTLPSVIKSEKYTFADLRQISCVIYKSNLIGELARFIVNEVPAFFMNGFRLAFINEHLMQDFNSFTPEELRGMLVDGLKMLTSQVNYLKDNQQKLESNYYALNNTIQSLQRDITKSVLKLDILDKELRSLKHSFIELRAGDEKKMEIPKVRETPLVKEVSSIDEAKFENEFKSVNELTLQNESLSEIHSESLKEISLIQDELLVNEPLKVKEILLTDEPIMQNDKTLGL